MATELQGNSQARLSKASTQLSRPSSLSGSEKQERIVQLLAKLGVRRQAKLDMADYLVLADDLVKYDLEDIAKGLDDIAKYPRREGETAFPEFARLRQAIGERRLTREAEEIRKMEAELAEYRKAHPGEFCTLKDIFDEWKLTHGATAELKSIPSDQSLTPEAAEVADAIARHRERNQSLPEGEVA
jgi:hypothetical protein